MTQFNYCPLYLGLYPGEHGVVANRFYAKFPNRQSGDFFNIDDQRLTKQPRWWQKNEPIWVTAAKQGKRFATYLWSR